MLRGPGRMYPHAVVTVLVARRSNMSSWKSLLLTLAALFGVGRVELSAYVRTASSSPSAQDFVEFGDA